MANDVICVPVGSSTPFVLRPTGKRDDGGVMQYNLVGRYYAHRFMDGEAISGIRTMLKNAERDKVSGYEKKKLMLA
jgi:hypothetical protein